MKLGLKTGLWQPFVKLGKLNFNLLAWSFDDSKKKYLATIYI